MKQIACAVFVLGLCRVQTALAQIPAGPFQGIYGPQSPATGGKRPTGPSKVPAFGPSLDAAVSAAKAAVLACAGKHIGVAILDSSGQPKLYYIPDGTSGDHAFMAFRKANTALLIKAPSEQISSLASKNPSLAAKISGNPNYITFGGGLPILSKGAVIGAIGISGGGPEGIDSGCARKALAAIADQLG